MQPLTPEDLQAFLSREGIPGEVVRFTKPTPTVEAAARAAQVPPERIVKTVVLAVDGQPLLVVTSGTAPLDLRYIARRLGVGRKRVRLATPEQVLAWTGYPVGGVPPLGHRQPLPTWLDRRLLAFPWVWAGGGDEHTLLRIAPETLRRATQAQVVDLEAEEAP